MWTWSFTSQTKENDHNGINKTNGGPEKFDAYLRYRLFRTLREWAGPEYEEQVLEIIQVECLPFNRAEPDCEHLHPLDLKNRQSKKWK